NPMVGAVIVNKGKIIGEGYHQRFGEAHAEVNAIKNATAPVKGATMYVTLEPCSHFGKTPPCSQLIIKHDIARVVIASRDPNPLVSGCGIQQLKQAGIEVEIGILDKENKILNKSFFKYMIDRKPHVILKTAMTLDGKTATISNQSKWISNEFSRAYVHELRHELQAIMVGINTVNYDDPMLTTRRLNEHNNHQPIRIIVDSQLSINIKSYIVQSAKHIPTIILTTNQANKDKIKTLETLGVPILIVGTIDNKVNLLEAMDMLGRRGISSILLEGGSTLAFSALKEGIVDEVYSFIAPKIFGGKTAPTAVGGTGVKRVEDAVNLNLKSIKQFNGDVCLIYDVLKEEQ
ncbi:MAG: bifunctional diaminohydroxyphosphoribosylaminopyrimidine deaminase/5-amino-6-(5-phosphoribosylamino)uracil reductase RibD, partial [Bacillota bacterium]